MSLLPSALLDRNFNVEHQHLKRVQILQIGEDSGRHHDPGLIVATAFVQSVKRRICKKCRPSVSSLTHVDPCIIWIVHCFSARQINDRRKVPWNRFGLRSFVADTVRNLDIMVNRWPFGSVPRGLGGGGDLGLLDRGCLRTCTADSGFPLMLSAVFRL
ncbi:hypothetical protein QQ25_18690 [Mycolicibacterium setense]|nr:hypothetical protein QQ25_18690 [Mycolicibacterium setense]